jgi:CRISPR-associated endonuclease Csn1
MREAVNEVFAGKHPTEEGGCLYRSEAVLEAQLQRSLEEKTNNHLVRHRVLIARRLVADVIKSYAAGEKSRIERVTIEVNRDLQAFSGMTNKEIEGELTQMLKDHSGVVKKLEKDFAEAGKNYRITPGLIRKARIAHDLGWKCPYTGKDFDAIDLAEGNYDKDHIIPRSLRPSDSLESLVITSKAINAMKGNRTAMQFIMECGEQPVEGERGVGKQKPNLTTVTSFRKFVEGLDTKGSHRQDMERKKKRKALLLLERYEEKGFLPKDLTQTSHLVRLAAAEMEKEFEGVERKPRIVSLPGSVTGEIRKGWKLYGCLAAHNPEVEKLLEREKTEEVNVKKELRDITHLHHALDACVIGYASHFLPNDGGLWETLVKRNRKPDENAMLLARDIFSQDSEGRARLSPLRDELKQQITERLGECRVVQHIPKRMAGLVGLEENTRGIVAIEIPDNGAQSGKKSKATNLKEIWNNRSKQPLPLVDDLDGAVVHLQQYGPRDPKNHDKRERKMTQEKAAKLLGLRPEKGDGKLRTIKGVRVVGANFGLALWKKDGKPDGEFQMRIILWHKVWPQLNEIAKKENGGKWPQVFRNGQLIKVAKGRYQGVWQISSIKNNQNDA